MCLPLCHSLVSWVVSLDLTCEFRECCGTGLVSWSHACHPLFLLLEILSTGAQEQYQQPWSKCQ